MSEQAKNNQTDEQRELQDAIERVLNSDSSKKLVVAGPGAGKTTLFKKLLEQQGGESENLVLTFINNLKSDLQRSLGDLASVNTLHGYSQYLLHSRAELRGELTAEFECYPGLISFIKQDWDWLMPTPAPQFVALMRDLELADEEFAFYLARSNYYDAIDFDDGVYRVYERFKALPESIPAYELVLVDEFQDFNKMEASVIGGLSDRSDIVIAGDDDQALYSKLRAANWDYIRGHHS